jgi:hypothetical protein
MNYTKAIDLEAAAWATFFGVTDAEQIEARRNVMRANVAVGYVKPLLPFIPTQARFWIDYKGSAVRLKINEGQTLAFSSGGPTDEGYSWTSEAYNFDGRSVACEWATDARDCDGRMTRTGSAYCDLARLSAGYHDAELNITFPAWENGETGQRDYAAEAMNY